MATAYKDEVQEQLPTASTLIYTAGALNSAHVVYATVYNESSSSSSITVNIVKSGGSVADSNIYLNKPIAAGDSVVLAALIGRVLETGDAVYALAGDADSLNLSVGIKEVS